jgi:hypothetical protein
MFSLKSESTKEDVALAPLGTGWIRRQSQSCSRVLLKEIQTKVNRKWLDASKVKSNRANYVLYLNVAELAAYRFTYEQRPELKKPHGVSKNWLVRYLLKLMERGGR